ncbi:L-type lectin-domain containing receptor kinase S.4-like [Rosa rugosa]|uniref:L-type lectin-domain containing receptor kinase S.4-like n=1 Tax=Rosa rugosa TaxID=74645 RepID=UPI002B4172EE|nr:L-type lectin-domain containing receptor kinase S.4-like [Rosa rugosa]
MNHHVGVNVGSFVSVTVGNVYSLNLMLNSGEKMKSWIDYDTSSKRLEIRFSKLGEPRPYCPIAAYGIDLLAMWKDKDLYAGISSSNSSGNSSQISSVNSWRFRLRKALRMSLPVNPREYLDDQHGQDSMLHKRMACLLSILVGCVEK